MDGECALPVAKNRYEFFFTSISFKKNGTAVVCSVWQNPGTSTILSSYSLVSIVPRGMLNTDCSYWVT
jgi:hypothetical protein